MVVVKFGGTSVGAPAQIDQAARIVYGMRDRKPIVIVSAMGGVTDALLQAGEAAVTGQTRQREDKLWEIRSRHDQAINELFKDRSIAVSIQDTLNGSLWEEMQKVFTGVSLLAGIEYPVARSHQFVRGATDRSCYFAVSDNAGTGGGADRCPRIRHHE